MTTATLVNVACSTVAVAQAATKLTLAKVIRHFGAVYRRQQGVALTVPEDRTLRDLEICRTPALGGEIRHCNVCGHEEAFYHSCRNRHCPRCSVVPRKKWYQERLAEVLPTPYYHLVFTLPDTVSALALDNAALIYNLLFTTASQTLLTVGRTYTPLRAETGFIAVLHTWSQLLALHVHLHVLWVGGGLALDGSGWRSLPTGFCLPKPWLMEAFRGAFLKGLQRLYREDQLVLRGVNGHLFAPAAFAAWIQELETKTWVLHAEPVTRGHESDQTPAEAAQQTLSYLARYANGVALSHERLIAIEGEDVLFSYKDRRDHNRRKTARVPGVKFLELFLQHVLPQGLRHIRHYGFLAQNKRGKMLPLIRKLLGCDAIDSDPRPPGGDKPDGEEEPPHRCRECGVGTLILDFQMERPSVQDIMDMSLQEMRQGRLPFQ